MQKKSEFMETIRAVIERTVHGYIGLMALHLERRLTKIVEDAIQVAAVEEPPEIEDPVDNSCPDVEMTLMEEVLEDPEEIRMK